MDETDFSLFDFESYYYKTESQERLSSLANYLAIMDMQVARIESEQFEQLNKDLETISDSWSVPDQYSFSQWRENEYHQFKSTFSESFHYSFVVLVWLVIEDELKRVCLEIQRRKELIPQKWEGNSIIKQCKEILKKVAGVPIENITLWSDIDNLQNVRNCIVHTSGFVNESRDKKHLIKLVEAKNPSLQIDNYDGRLRIETEYCQQAVQITGKFLEEIFDRVGFKDWKESDKK
jgi:hypothetical protein